MRDLYLGTIVDITDPQCEFIREFNGEIRKYGAIVYNQDYNTYQFVRSFDAIDFKREMAPDFLKVESAGPLLKGMKVTIHYEFDPEQEYDDEINEIWNELSQIELSIVDYDEDGEIYEKNSIAMNNQVTTHIIWFLDPKSFDYILDVDLLMLAPVIKDLNIARKLIKDYGLDPFQAVYDQKDIDEFQLPDLSAYFEKKTKEIDE